VTLLADLWVFFLLAFAAGFAFGWFNRWPIRR
jgi:hypothetical protein